MAKTEKEHGNGVIENIAITAVIVTMTAAFQCSEIYTIKQTSVFAMI